MTPITSTRFLIVSSLGFQVVALAIVMGLGTWGIHHMSRTEDLEFYDGFAMIEAAYRLRMLADQEIIHTRGRLLAPRARTAAGDPEAVSASLAEDYERTLNQVAGHSSERDRALIGAVTGLGHEYRAYMRRIERLLERGDLSGAQRLHVSEGRALKARWLPLLDELITRFREQVNAHHEEVNATENMIKLAMLVAALVTVPTALILAIATGGRVLRPLERLEAAANAVGAGRLDARVLVERDDEFGHVARSFNSMAGRMGEAVETLRAANEELVRLDRHKDEFLSIVSHELRTPLNAMKGFATLMSSGMAGPISEQQRQYAANIGQSADRMGRLVNDLLDLASFRLQKLRLEREPTDYRVLVEDVVATMAPIAAERGMHLVAEFDGEAEPDIDYDRIAQVLTNLLDNALKFTPPGGRIAIRVARQGEWLLTEMRDTGIGIADADLAKLFQPFSQVDMGPSRRAGGTGLGLSICKAIVEAHDGEIGVRSLAGLGSTFWFKLPQP